jgi:hypothetical protein
VIKRALVLAAIIVVVLSIAAAGCVGGTPRPAPRSPRPPVPPDELPVESRSDFFEELTRSGYALWATAPSYEELQPSQGPHGDEVQIFLDPSAEMALEQRAEEWPEGAVIVKDIYREGELVQIAAMKKTDDAWYWGEWDSGGTTIAEGQAIEECEGCHAAGKDGTLGVQIGE